MSKRLQVLLEASEFGEIQRVARAQKLTVAEWVRQVLRAARRQLPQGDSGKKLEIVREAASHTFPTGEMGQMLAEIERGYLGQGPE